MATTAEIAQTWVQQYGFIFAVSVAAVTMAICYIRKGTGGLSWLAPVLDMLRAAAAFPLLMFTVSPLYPDWGRAVLHEEPLVVALGAAGGVAALASDWWRNI